MKGYGYLYCANDASGSGWELFSISGQPYGGNSLESFIARNIYKVILDNGFRTNGSWAHILLLYSNGKAAAYLDGKLETHSTLNPTGIATLEKKEATIPIIKKDNSAFGTIIGYGQSIQNYDGNVFDFTIVDGIPFAISESIKKIYIPRDYVDDDYFTKYILRGYNTKKPGLKIY